MTKKKERITILIWLFITTAIRVLYYLLDYRGVEDPYGFFDGAILRAEQKQYYLDSGLGFAYTNAIAKFVTKIGNDISVIFVWQLLMELVSLVLIVLAAQNFWGIYSAVIIGCLLSASPVLLVFLRTCSPEEYFLIYFSIIFFILSYFYRYSRKKSWFRSSLGELMMLVMGIYIGMLCVWNYLGFMAFATMFVIVIKNYRIIKDKSHLLELTDGDEIEEKDQIMNVFVQSFMIILGTAIGMFFTFLKYTGYTGYTIVEEMIWWKEQFKTLPQRTMDFDTYFAVYLILSVVIGSIAGAIIHKVKKPKKSKQQQAEEEEMARSENYEVKKKEENPTYFVTPDGRKVDYLENPLPGPKKHEHKEMRFDLDEISRENQEIVIYDETVDINYESIRKSILDVEGENLGVRFTSDKRPDNNKTESRSENEEKPKAPQSKEEKAAVRAALSAVSNEDKKPEAYDTDLSEDKPIEVKGVTPHKKEETPKIKEESAERKDEPTPVMIAHEAATKLRAAKDDFDFDVGADDDFDY